MNWMQSTTWKGTLIHPISHPRLVKTSIEKENHLQLLMDMNFMNIFSAHVSLLGIFPCTQPLSVGTLEKNRVLRRINRSEDLLGVFSKSCRVWFCPICVTLNDSCRESSHIHNSSAVWNKAACQPCLHLDCQEGKIKCNLMTALFSPFS